MEEQPHPHETIEYSASRLFELFEKARPLYDSGLSLEQVAKRLQVGKATVGRALNNGGLRLRPSIHTPQGLAARRKRTSPGGVAPYGYAYLGGRIVVHPSEINVVSDIQRLRKSGETFCSIACKLNSQKIRTRNGKQWTHSLVSRIVRRDSDKLLNRLRQGG